MKEQLTIYSMLIVGILFLFIFVPLSQADDRLEIFTQCYQRIIQETRVCESTLSNDKYYRTTYAEGLMIHDRNKYNGNDVSLNKFWNDVRSTIKSEYNPNKEKRHFKKLRVGIYKYCRKNIKQMRINVLKQNIINKCMNEL